MLATREVILYRVSADKCDEITRAIGLLCPNDLLCVEPLPLDLKGDKSLTL